MKKVLCVALVATLTMIVFKPSYAQEWSKEQMEVWKVVQNIWQGWKDGNNDLVSAGLHAKYQGWSDDAPLPMGKETLLSWFTAMKGAFQVNYYSIEPARITVTKSAAVVDYYYYMNVSSLGEDKKTEEEKGKVVEFYIKEGDNWLLLGDLMVKEDKDDD